MLLCLNCCTTSWATSLLLVYSKFTTTRSSGVCVYFGVALTGCGCHEPAADMLTSAAAEAQISPDCTLHIPAAAAAAAAALHSAAHGNERSERTHTHAQPNEAQRLLTVKSSYLLHALLLSQQSHCTVRGR